MKKDIEKESLQRIVEAATDIFAEVGYAGARIDAIAKRAGLNKAAIYYHIGGKRELYNSVLQTLLNATVEQTIQHMQEVSSPEDKLRYYIRGLAQAIDQNPAIAPILLREMAVSGEHLSEMFFQTIFGLLGTLMQILNEGEQQGVFVPTVPLVIHFMTIGTLILSKVRGTLLAQNARFSEMLHLLEGQPTIPLASDISVLFKKLQAGEQETPDPNITDELEKLIIRAVMREI
jgi:AcrR family transcriptional regulator